MILNDLESLAKFLVHKEAVTDGAAHRLSALLVKVLLIAHVIYKTTINIISNKVLSK